MSLHQPILLLTDYRGAYQSTVASKSLSSMNVSLIVAEFLRRGLEVEVCRFGDLNFAKSFSGRYVIYTSSEDSSLRYKSFIEDILLTLDQLDAIILPRYALLRAHHNKVMMEGLRYSFFPEEASALATKLFGAFEDLPDDAGEFSRYPKVIKSAAGAGSISVALASDRSDLLSKLRKLSRSVLTYNEILREVGKRWLRKDWHPRSLHREKFIVQNMIPGLEGDFKVLAFGDRYYVLSRKNRPGDFRASGSGLFSHEIPATVKLNDLLNFAKKCFRRIDTPTLSMDIAFDGQKFWLVEFQAVHFGTLTAETAPHYYIQDDQAWASVTEKCVIESVYVEAIVRYLSNSQLKSED